MYENWLERVAFSEYTRRGGVLFSGENIRLTSWNIEIRKINFRGKSKNESTKDGNCKTDFLDAYDNCYHRNRWFRCGDL